MRFAGVSFLLVDKDTYEYDSVMRKDKYKFSKETIALNTEKMKMSLEKYNETQAASYNESSISSNPWDDVFGPGEESDTAYWNTD